MSGLNGRFNVSRSFVVCAISMGFQFLAKTQINEKRDWDFCKPMSCFAKARKEKMIALKNIFKSSTHYFQTHVSIFTANTHWIEGNISETKMNLAMRSAAFQRKQNCDCTLLTSRKKKCLKNLLITPQYVFWFSQQWHICTKVP